ERDGEDRARLPLEGDARPGVVPNGRGAAARQHQDHLLEQVVLRRERLPRRDLADVAVVRGARGLVVDEHALAVLARPGLELDRAQVRHVLRADDVEPLGAHEPQIGRVLLGLELVGHLLRDDRILGHRGASRVAVLVALVYQRRAGRGNALWRTDLRRPERLRSAGRWTAACATITLDARNWPLTVTRRPAMPQDRA